MFVHRAAATIAVLLSALLALPIAPAVADDLSDLGPTPPAKVSSAETWTSQAVKASKGYSPRRGVTFNNPLGGPKATWRIHDQILTAVNNTPKHATIRIMSWNIMSRSATNALLRAQQRGVRVRVLIDNTNLVDVPNPSYRRLVGGLRAGNKSRAKMWQSKAKTCMGSCRGRGEAGSSHAKFFLFSKTGKAKRVLMEGSANLTAAAATNQWNDIYTFVGNRKFYDGAVDVFDQMWRDNEVPDPYVQLDSKKVSLMFSPYLGEGYQNAGGDQVEGLLRSVKCRGAVDAGNDRGRTVIRVAPDVMRNERGMRAAVILRRLWNQGCDVQIAYTVLSYQISRYLRANVGRGPVPLRHLVQDFDGDGEFDRYFHLKALSINGVVGGDRTAFVSVNGSSNMSGLASFSDENIAIFRNRKTTLKYQKYISYWFANQPSSVSFRPTLARPSLVNVDPYANVDMD